MMIYVSDYSIRVKGEVLVHLKVGSSTLLGHLQPLDTRRDSAGHGGIQVRMASCRTDAMGRPIWSHKMFNWAKDLLTWRANEVLQSGKALPCVSEHHPPGKWAVARPVRKHMWLEDVQYTSLSRWCPSYPYYRWPTVECDGSPGRHTSRWGCVLSHSRGRVEALTTRPPYLILTAIRSQREPESNPDTVPVWSSPGFSFTTPQPTKAMVFGCQGQDTYRVP